MAGVVRDRQVPVKVTAVVDRDADDLTRGIDETCGGGSRATAGAAEDQRRKRHGIPPFQMRQCFLKTIIIFHGDVMPNWPRPPVQERSVGTSEDPTSWEANSALRLADYACRFQRHRHELRTRKFRAFPPLVLRCSSGLPERTQIPYSHAVRHLR